MLCRLGLGTGLGDGFGNRFGNRFGDRLGDRFGNRFGNGFGDRFGDRLRDRFGDRFGDRLRDRFGNGFGDRFRLGFDRDDLFAAVQTEGSAGKELCAAVGAERLRRGLSEDGYRTELIEHRRLRCRRLFGRLFFRCSFFFLAAADSFDLRLHLLDRIIDALYLTALFYYLRIGRMAFAETLESKLSKLFK